MADSGLPFPSSEATLHDNQDTNNYDEGEIARPDWRVPTVSSRVILTPKSRQSGGPQ